MERISLLRPLFWLTRLGLSVLYWLRELRFRPDRETIHATLPDGMERGSWSRAPKLPSYRYEFSAAMVRSKIYVVGGVFQPSVWLPTDRVEAFDLETQAWEALPPAPTPMHHIGLVGDGRYLYVAGGNRLRVWPLKDSWRFDPETAAWDRIAPLPRPRGAAGAAYLDGSIYVVGGCDGRSRLGATHRYVIAEDRWEELPDMPTPREHLMVVACEGRIHALGGFLYVREGLTVHEVFDPATKTWEDAEPLPLALFGAGAASLGSSIFVFGGEQGWAVSPYVFEYETKSGVWRRHADLPVKRYANAAVAGAGVVHVVGGNTRPFGGDFSFDHDVFDPAGADVR